MAAKETEDTLTQLNAGFTGGMAAWFKKQMDAGRIRKLPREIFLALLLAHARNTRGSIWQATR